MILNRLFLFKIAVILLVRMWVEMEVVTGWTIRMRVILLVRMWVEITSCSSVIVPKFVILLVRMWVEILACFWVGRKPLVILLVRMWVEIADSREGDSIRVVILLVRMWVEMRYIYSHQSAFPSSSLRGYELKCQIKGNFYNRCTVILLVRMCVRGNNWFNVRRHSGIFLSESRRLQFL